MVDVKKYETLVWNEYRETFEKFRKLLLEYNENYNLTTILEEKDVYYKHFIDSVVGESFFPKNARVAEIGSGAGFPSIPLKIIRPDLSLDLYESVGKKCEFLRVIVDNLGLTNVHIYNSVPQIEVLRMADAFVTHGGMNSVSEAMAYGVPMVVIPFVSDQPVNARCVERIGIGKKLNYSEADKISIKTAVFSIIADNEVTDNIKRVQGLIESAPGNNGGAEMIVKYYNETVDSVKKK